MENKTKKKELRIWAKNIRKTLDITEKSRLACEQVRVTEVYKSAKNVMIFYPMNNELNLRELLKDDKNFYLPKIIDENIFACPFEIGDNLIKSNINVNEPCTNPVEPAILDLVIVPALAVDEHKFRLGYGGGFYDRFLSANPQIKSLVVIAKELIIPSLPTEAFDKPCDFMVSV